MVALGNSTFVNCPIVASRNQGNCLNDRKNSVLLIKSQNPFGETLATSTAEVRLPRVADFDFMFFYQAEYGVNLLRF